MTKLVLKTEGAADREFKAVKCKTPKRAFGTVPFTIDGKAVVAKYTDNAAWAKCPAGVLTYAYFTLDDTEVYIASDYAEGLAAFKDRAFTTEQGVGPNIPARITTEIKREELRIARFKETISKK